MIRVNNLRKHFKTFKKDAGFFSSMSSLVKRDYEIVRALKGISFSAELGDILGFIGPNGAGKSTTIKILSGILYPTSGSVRVNGFSPWKERENYVRTIGVVFGQKQQLWLDLPPIDTFYLNKSIYEIPDTTFQTNLDYFIELFKVKEIIRRPTRQLSLGEKMKCELISSLLHDPAVVFLDEPTIGLDVIAKEKMREFIKQINRDKKITFLLTTHDLDDIENLCERVVIINKGKIVYDGSIKELKKEVFQTKLLAITLQKNISKKINQKGVKVLRREDFDLLIEVDTKKSSIKAVVTYFFNNFPIKDIDVSNPTIESIIKKIYETSDRGA